MRATARGITKDRISGYVFIAPAVVLFAIFQIFPLFRTAVLSFQEFIGSTFVPVGAKNYIELFGDNIFARSLLTKPPASTAPSTTQRATPATTRP